MMNLATYLTASNLTQDAFAAQIGVKQATVSRLVRGTAKPSIRVMAEIERATAGAVPAASWFPETSQSKVSSHG